MQAGEFQLPALQNVSEIGAGAWAVPAVAQRPPCRCALHHMHTNCLGQSTRFSRYYPSTNSC